MHPYFWVDFISLFISLIISISFLLMVLGVAPRHHENQAFSLFALAEILWNIAAINLRLSLINQSGLWSVPMIGAPQTWFRLTSVFTGFMCLLSLYFTAVFLRIKSNLIKWCILPGLFLMIFLNLSISPKTIVNARFNSMGLVTDTVKPLGWIVILFFTSYMLSAIVLMFKHKTKEDTKFIGSGLLIIYIGLIFGGALNLLFPSMSIFNTLGLIIIGYAILRLQILNPLKTLNSELKTLIVEKEILLKEIHHRVKNNMQLIESLLNIEYNKTTNPEALQILKSSKNRIHSISVIHEGLYQKDTLTQIDFNTYVHKLTQHLNQSYRLANNPIKFKININHINLPVDVAVPCGLILNELITNAIKHAFPKSFKHTPEISIAIEQKNNDSYIFRVGDNGRGLPKNLVISDKHTFGLYSVQLLVQHQLEGELNIQSTSKGTLFTIQFDIHDE